MKRINWALAWALYGVMSAMHEVGKVTHPTQAPQYLWRAYMALFGMSIRAQRRAGYGPWDRTT